MRKDWKLIVAVICLVVTSVLLFFRGEANAFDLFSLRDVAVTYKSYQAGSVEPFITQNPLQPDRILDKGVDLEVNTDLLKYLYWDNIIHSLTDRSAVDGSGQFRMVGLEWRLGIDLQRVWKALPLSIGLWHYSKHLLDAEWGLGHIPVSDAIEFRLKLYERK